MQRDDSSDETAQVEHEQLVVRRNRERLFASLALLPLLEPFEVGKQVEDVLEVVDDLMVDRHLAADDGGKIVADFGQMRCQTAKRREPVRDPR